MIQFVKDLISLFLCLFSFLVAKKNQITLVYHSISVIAKEFDPLRINIDPELFAKQISYLSRLNPKTNILVTFDDGFENFFYDAFPLILKYNIRSIIFVTADFINGKITFDHLTGVKGKLRPLRWSQLREIANKGVEIGSHTLTHPDLSTLNEELALRQILDSKKIIEDNIGKEVKYFAYPYGAKNTFNDRIKQIVKNSGYDEAYTNIMGFNRQTSDKYELKRIRIYSNDNMFRFRLKLRGAYNWVDWMESFKVGKQCLRAKI